MNQESREWLWDLLRTPSPSGAEQAIQHLIYDRMRPVVELCEPDVHGNLLLGTHTDARYRVLLDGHCDQIGFMVRYISDEGLLYIEALGGVDESVLLGARVVVHSADGPIPGVFGKKAVHLQSTSETATVPLPESMWIDVGASSRQELEKTIPIGTPVTFELRVVELRNRRILAPGLDNKAGLFVVLETLRRCAAEDLQVGLYVSSSVQEELGLRGAGVVSGRLNPDIGITVDVTHALDDPGAPPRVGAICKLGGGPCISWGPNTNPVLSHRLAETARRQGITHQPSPSASLAGNDSKKIQVSGTGVATADIGIPNRNMHTPAEICCLDDMEATIELLVAFVTSLEAQPDLTPFHFAGCSALPMVPAK
jgi:tetrahedral aminopeptidase